MPGNRYDTLLRKFPDAKNITKLIAGIDIEFNSKTKSIIHEKKNVSTYFFRALMEKLPRIQEDENVYDILCKTIKHVFYDIIKHQLQRYSDMIHNMDDVAMSITKQALRTIPDDVRQLCLLVTKLNQSEKNRFYEWDKIFSRFTVIKERIIQHQEHIEALLKKILYRINKDKFLLRDEFEIENLTIKDFKLSLGDFHQVGESVVRVQLNSTSLIYKPRSADNEKVVKDLLEITGINREDLAIGIPAFVSMDGYSWHKDIEFSNPENKKDVMSYYRNIGSSLVFFHLVNGSDFHYENVICANNIPYFVDLECIFTSFSNPGFFSDSILNTIIIPPLSGSPLDTYICGIGEKDVSGEQYKRKILDIDETKKIIKIETIDEIPSYFNRPYHNAAEMTSEEIIQATNEGINKTIDLMKGNSFIIEYIKKNTLAKSRVLFRSSRAYRDIISLSNHPAYSSDPLLRSAFISCVLNDNNIPVSVLKYEYQAILEGRIPVFHKDLKEDKCYSADGDELKINTPMYTYKQYLSKIHRMLDLDEEAELQKNLANLSLNILFPCSVNTGKNEDIIDRTVEFMAGDIINHKKQDIILNVKRDVNGVRIISKMESDIYNGLCGATFMQLCNVIINSSKDKVDKLFYLYEMTKKLNSTDSFGCFEDNGGLLYIEYLMYKHLKTENGVEIFNSRITKVINIIKKHDDVLIDIISGIAGILIICCRMYVLYPCRKYKIVIKYLTSIILRKSVDFGDSLTWCKRWTGFAHGNSGIVYSLMLANNILKDKNINSVLVRALKYEQLFRIDDGWKGVDIHDRNIDFNSWCHGATGTYLSRKAMQEEIQFENNYFMDIVHSDIEHYQSTKKNRSINYHPSLCHGAYGNAVIDPMTYGADFELETPLYNISDDKSLMHGKAGALYAKIFIKNTKDKIPNILLLK